jgi:hypothetical protein
MRWVFRGASSLALAVVPCAVPALASCGGPPAASPYDVLKVPDERTATGWIAKAFRKQGYEVEGNREIKIGTGALLIADVAATDDVWSVVWLRPDEVAELKGKLPPPPPGVADGSLWVMSGTGADSNQRMLILMAKAFEYDPDPRGKGVMKSMEEVEARAIRDVTDFLVRAKAGEIE